MNALHWYLAIGLGVVVLIVLAVIWSLRRMPSEAELEELSRRFPEEGHCAAASRQAREEEQGSGSSAQS